MQKSAIHKHESPRWCPNCQIGKQSAKLITFTARVNDALLQVPDVNLYTCDICGYEEMDADMGEMIDELSRLGESSSEDVAAGVADQTARQSLSVYNHKDIRPK